MNNWLNKMSWKHPRWGIPHLMFYICATTAAVYLAEMMTGGSGVIYNMLYFNKYLILQGQVWRLVSFLFIPNADRVIFVIISLFFYTFIGDSLEKTWGTFKLTAYYLFGWLFTAVGGMVMGFAVSYYLNLSLFLAFARIYPDMQLRLYGILPVKTKYIAYFDWLLYAIDFARGIYYGAWYLNVMILLAVGNYLLFFGKDIWRDFKEYRQYGPQRRQFKNNKQDNPWGF